MGKLSLGLGLGVGYVLGAQAGRARYEQIKRAAAGLMERPEVQQAVERARSAAPAPLQGSLDKLTGRGSGGGQGTGAPSSTGTGTGAGTGTGTGTVDAVPSAPPLPDTGSAEASLPDPLIPPAKSVDDPSGP